jgi:hypothetical protein
MSDYFLGLKTSSETSTTCGLLSSTSFKTVNEDLINSSTSTAGLSLQLKHKIKIQITTPDYV